MRTAAVLLLLLVSATRAGPPEAVPTALARVPWEGDVADWLPAFPAGMTRAHVVRWLDRRKIAYRYRADDADRMLRAPFTIIARPQAAVEWRLHFDGEGRLVSQDVGEAPPP